MTIRDFLKRVPGARRLHAWLGKFVAVHQLRAGHVRQVSMVLSLPVSAPPPIRDAPDIGLPEGEIRGIKLNVGGGKGHPRFEGWTVVDLRESTADLVIDIANERLPYEDDSVDVIFSSHTLEHIYPQRLGFVLGEFHRVLRPGTGLLRISVPDIETAIDAYRRNDYSFFMNSDVASFDKTAPIGGLLASWFYSTRIFSDAELKHGEGHVNCFDYDCMAHWLRRCGFRRVWHSAYRQSILPELHGEGFDLKPHDSLFVEAMK